jgi:RNA polymerase sigma-B factor
MQAKLPVCDIIIDMAKEGAPQDNGHHPNGNGTYSHAEHSHLITSISRPYYGVARKLNMDPEDVRQVATEHFILASHRYTPNDEASLTTFVTHRVVGGIKDEFSDRGWAIKVSRRIRRAVPKVQYATAQLSQALGRQPSEDEVAEHLSVSPRFVRRVKVAMDESVIRPSGLVEDHTDHRHDDLKRTNTVDASRTLVAEKGETAYEAVLDRMVLKDALASLPPRLREVVSMHFGLNMEGREMSHIEIAEIYDITQSRVTQLLNEALEHLRKKLKDAA